MIVYLKIQATQMAKFRELRNLAGQKTDTQKSIAFLDFSNN